MSQLRVGEWMTTEPITIPRDTTLPVAYQLMRLNHIRRLPAVNDEGRLVGIVTMGDVREARPKESMRLSFWEMHDLAANLEVQTFMTVEPVTVTPDTSIKQAAELMLEHKVGGLPVVEDDAVVGIITESDIFRVLVQQLLNTEPVSAPVH